MLKIYTYWSNKTEWHQEKLAEVSAETISIADTLFEQATKLNPSKCGWVGLTITKQVE